MDKAVHTASFCLCLLIVARGLLVSAEVGLFREPTGAAPARQMSVNVGCTVPTCTLAFFMRRHARVEVISLADIYWLPLIILIHPRKDVIARFDLRPMR